MPQISVIVPVYRVENYIHRCVDSILSQTFADFELILVDDGSPDNCGAICDEYVQKDSRVRVIHKENGGLSSARNAGLDIAIGKYILFCDSDDYVAADWCEQFVQKTVDTEDNYIFGAMRTVKVSASEEIICDPPVLEQDSWDVSEYLSVGILGFACNVMYYADVLRKYNLRFSEEVIVEDLPFNFNYVQYMKKLSYTGRAGYFYIQDCRETLSRKYYPNMFRKYQEKYKATQAFIDKTVPEERQEAHRRDVADKYLYWFLSSLNATLDDRNKASIWAKLRYNIAVVHSEEFQHCLHYADARNENKRIIKLLKQKNYIVVFLIQQTARFKRYMLKGGK